MKTRLLLLSILLISSPHLAAGMFDQLIQEGVNAVGKGISKASGVTDDGKTVVKDDSPKKKVDRVTKSSLRDCDEKSDDWQNCYGKMVGKGESYYGEFSGNQFHGQGTYNFSDGDKYVGAFEDGQMHGQGTYTHASGDTSDPNLKYVGSYRNGYRNGQGTLNKRDGTVLVGNFVDGQLEVPPTETEILEGKLKDYYEAYFLVRACNDLDTKYISNSQLKKTKKAIRSLDDQAKKQGVDTDKVYKDAETNPSESTNNSLAMVKTIKLLGGANFNPQLRTMCMGQSNILILLAEGDKAKKQKGKKDF